MVLLHAAPGAEVTLGKWVLLWARVDVEVPLSTRSHAVFDAGGTVLAGHPTPDTSDELLSLGGSVGLTLRFRIKPRWTGKRAPPP